MNNRANYKPNARNVNSNSPYRDAASTLLFQPASSFVNERNQFDYNSTQNDKISTEAALQTDRPTANFEDEDYAKQSALYQNIPAVPASLKYPMVIAPPFKVSYLAGPPQMLSYEAVIDKKINKTIFKFIKIAGKFTLALSNSKKKAATVTLELDRFPLDKNKQLKEFNLKISKAIAGWDKDAKEFSDLLHIFAENEPHADIEFKGNIENIEATLTVPIGGKINVTYFKDFIEKVFSEFSGAVELVPESVGIELWVLPHINISPLKKLLLAAENCEKELNTALERVEKLEREKGNPLENFKGSPEKRRAIRQQQREIRLKARKDVKAIEKKLTALQKNVANAKADLLRDPLKHLYDHVLKKNPSFSSVEKIVITSYDKLLDVKAFSLVENVLSRMHASTVVRVSKICSHIYAVLTERLKTLILKGLTALGVAPSGAGILLSAIEIAWVAYDLILLAIELLPLLGKLYLEAADKLLDITHQFVDFVPSQFNKFIDEYLVKEKKMLESAYKENEEAKQNFETNNQPKEKELQEKIGILENEAKALETKRDAEAQRLDNQDIIAESESQNISERDKELKVLNAALSEKYDEIEKNKQILRSLDEERKKSYKNTEDEIKVLKVYIAEIEFCKGLLNEGSEAVSTALATLEKAVQDAKYAFPQESTETTTPKAATKTEVQEIEMRRPSL